jgi:glyoxylase-like metal-dependent hydrolase (beta-lactamase superfamily II)
VPDGEIGGLLPPADFEIPGRTVPADVLIEDGDLPLGQDTTLRAIWTPGHTPGHLCFADERYDVLLTGDHVLPRISPNISPTPASAEDTLGSYLRSLDALADRDPAEVLPAHEYLIHLERRGLLANTGDLTDGWRAVPA